MSLPRPPRRTGPRLRIAVLIPMAIAGALSAESSPAQTSATVEPGAASESTIQFRDVASSWGLDFRHRHAGAGDNYMIETMIGGVALFDYDGDGDLDVFWVDGGMLPGYEGPPPKSRLLRNDGPQPGGGLRFIDVTDQSGIEWSGYSCGAAVGDVDGDGWPDLYLTAFGRNGLFRNLGDGSFKEEAVARGVAEERWSSSAGFADLDLDGDLDLYVGNYTDHSLENHIFCGDKDAGERGYCHPDVYNGLVDTLYRNTGEGVFEDATEASGLSGSAEATLGVVIGDLDDDGWPDIYTANDKDPNLLFLNSGDGTFEDWSLLSGAALERNGQAEAGMGVEMADLDGDGRLDLFVTNFALETNALYRNLGGGTFVDDRFRGGVAEASLHLLGFGTNAGDFDNDTDLDLVVANGHILPNAARLSKVKEYAQRNLVMENLGGGRYVDRLGTGLDVVRPSRGSAIGDLDLDGDLEVLVVNSNDTAEVYENVGAPRPWLRVQLEGRRSNRAALGARVLLAGATDRPMLREVRSASSYLSQSEATLHWGLGKETAEAKPLIAEIRWPGGARQRIEGLPRDRVVRVVEPWVRAAEAPPPP